MVQIVRIITPEEERTFARRWRRIAGLVAAYLVVFWLWGKIIFWQTLDKPYNVAAGFYYYLVIVPLASFGTVWDWLTQKHFTHYPNVNLCIEIVGVVFYGFFLLFVIGFISAVLQGVGVKPKVQAGILAAPALIALIWFVLSLVLGWLLAQ